MRRARKWCYGFDGRCTCDCYGCTAHGLGHCSRVRWTLRELFAAWWHALDL
jgi:hypothetical protein